jgi:hypothetical protein
LPDIRSLKRGQPWQRLRPAGEGFLRMSLVENEARLRQAVRQIKACLREAEGGVCGQYGH